MTQPNALKHILISMVKSAVRVLGCAWALAVGVWEIAIIALLLAEVIGILEECV